MWTSMLLVFLTFILVWIWLSFDLLGGLFAACPDLLHGPLATPVSRYWLVLDNSAWSSMTMFCQWGNHEGLNLRAATQPIPSTPYGVQEKARYSLGFFPLAKAHSEFPSIGAAISFEQSPQPAYNLTIIIYIQGTKNIQHRNISTV